MVRLMITKILKALGMRSRCHGAPMVFRLGWSFKQDGKYCTACDELQLAV